MTPKSILIVEDDVDLCDMAELVLQKLKYPITKAYDGKEAKHFLLEASPTVIILDLCLPYISGKDILRYIKMASHLDKAKVIIVTVLSRDETWLLKEKVEIIIRKPYDVHNLRDTVARLLDSTDGRMQ